MFGASRIVFLLMLAATAGCNCVRVDQPFGTPPDAAQLKSLVGKWVDSDGGVVELRLDHQGHCVAGTMDWSMKSDKFEAQTEVIDVRLLAGKLMGFVRADQGYYFAWVEVVDSESLKIYLPDSSQFRKAALLGSVQQNSHGGHNDRELILVANPGLAEWLKQPQNWKVAFKSDEAVGFKRIEVASRTKN